jgi:hypothetical protein
MRPVFQIARGRAVETIAIRPDPARRRDR